MSDLLWNFSVSLSCGCMVRYGVVSGSHIEELTPRRKDGSFGALLCPNRHRRRRVVYTRSDSTGILA